MTLALKWARRHVLLEAADDVAQRALTLFRRGCIRVATRHLPGGGHAMVVVGNDRDVHSAGAVRGRAQLGENQRLELGSRPRQLVRHDPSLARHVAALERANPLHCESERSTCHKGGDRAARGRATQPGFPAGSHLPRDVRQLRVRGTSSERPARPSPTGGVVPGFGHRNQALALGLFPGGLARAADRFRFLTGLALGRLFIGLATLHFTKHALTLHLLLESPESLFDIVVANEYLQMFSNRVAGALTGAVEVLGNR